MYYSYDAHWWHLRQDHSPSVTYEYDTTEAEAEQAYEGNGARPDGDEPTQAVGSREPHAAGADDVWADDDGVAAMRDGQGWTYYVWDRAAAARQARNAETDAAE